MTLGEFLLELEYAGVGTDYWCAVCSATPALEIAKLDVLAYELRCGQCGSIWRGERNWDLVWQIDGFDGLEEIYSQEETMVVDTLQSHLQDLVRQHLSGADRRNPALFAVRWNRGAPRLSYMCGENPHYVAILTEETGR